MGVAALGLLALVLQQALPLEALSRVSERIVGGTLVAIGLLLVDVALDSGVARESALASVGLLDYLHRDAALVVFAGALLIVVWLRARFPKERTLIRWAYVVAGLATLQVAFGAVMAYVSLKPAIQVGHLTVASLLLGAETVLLLLGKTEPGSRMV